MLLQYLTSMHMAMIFMIIDAQYMLAMRVFAFPALIGSLYLFNNPSFNTKNRKG